MRNIIFAQIVALNYIPASSSRNAMSILDTHPATVSVEFICAPGEAEGNPTLPSEKF